DPRGDRIAGIRCRPRGSPFVRSRNGHSCQTDPAHVRLSRSRIPTTLENGKGRGMKRILGPASLAVAAVAALALAGNAFATQRVVVSQTPAALTIKASQDQSDEQPARITVYVPAGYTVNATQTPGTKVGTAT